MRTQAEISNNDWFGNLLKGWEMKPLKSIFTFSKGLSITKNDLTETGKSVISYGQIHSKDYFGTGIVNNIIRYVSDEIAEKGDSSLVNKGGFVFADTSEDLAGVGNCAYNDLEKTIYGGYHTIVLNPLYETDNKFLAYQFRTDAWRHQLRRQLVDVKLFSVNQRILSEAYAVLPPADVRRSIVSFLNARCAPIDEAITRHHKAISKLEEYRKAVISHTVNGAVEGMDSSNWVWKRFKFIARVDSNLVEPDRFENWLHIAPDSIGKGDGRLLHRHTVSEDSVISGNHLFRKGAILYSKVRPRLNKVVIAPDDGLCSADMYPISTNQVVEWLKYYMLSDQFVEQAGTVSDIRIKMPKINKEELGNLKILVPPYKDQLKIVSRLNSICASIDESINRQNQIISKLAEYRRSLIHAAVTGRIDCTKEPL